MTNERSTFHTCVTSILCNIGSYVLNIHPKTYTIFVLRMEDCDSIVLIYYEVFITLLLWAV